MNSNQIKILELSKTTDLSRLSYREIGKKVGIDHSQVVKYHINQLRKKGLLSNSANNKSGNLVSIPIYGEVSCGPANAFADDKIQSFIKVSVDLLSETTDIFALIARGNSMNNANINNKPINDGDFVIVHKRYPFPKDGDYVVSIINNEANLKRLKIDKVNRRYILTSESKDDFSPIIISDTDQYTISGKVVDVIPRID